MDEYELTFARTARKELEALDAPTLNRVFPKIEMLTRAPRPRGSRKLRGENNLWRIRVGDYRVLYAVDDEACSIDVIAIRHRKDAYR